MAITSAICTSFKQQLLVGTHNFTNGADSFKLALYTSSATLGAGPRFTSLRERRAVLITLLPDLP
jgi:hypothetical protein